jgi:hypothetical protein
MKERKNTRVFFSDDLASFLSTPGPVFRPAFQSNGIKYKNIPAPKNESGMIHIPKTLLGG